MFLQVNSLQMTTGFIPVFISLVYPIHSAACSKPEALINLFSGEGHPGTQADRGRRGTDTYCRQWLSHGLSGFLPGTLSGKSMARGGTRESRVQTQLWLLLPRFAGHDPPRPYTQQLMLPSVSPLHTGGFSPSSAICSAPTNP